ncbi:hypothetical protein BDZ94DRAFT_1256418 [Collybia nuda]|uniref:Uncharacterized protein n=1 Tax=Collybia nuda TaxID=64659 RepID=A0A9P5Y925_9AGAR|nr:hypothetical protein BDZ94DRAFT_1256418 [Collybia nuda]
MSFFSRPDSPPPRQPSPDFLPAPLPSPHLRARLRHSSSKHSLPNYSPSLPPGLTPDLFPRYMRSYDHINASIDGFERKRARSALTASPPTTPRSLPVPSSSRASDERPHRRCLSSAIPYRSPPPSPTISLAPPPVPPIPAFVLTPLVDIKSPPRQKPSLTTPIHLPELDNLPSLPQPTRRSRKQSRPLPLSTPSPEKHRSVGMTCLKFFSIRKSR